MFVVGKSFTAEGIIRRTGEVVKASGWRHVKRLLEQRYLSVFDGEPVKCAKCGRMFTNDELLQDHIRIDHPELKAESKQAERKTEQKDAKADTSKEAEKEAKPKTTKPKETKKGGK